MGSLRKSSSARGWLVTLVGMLAAVAIAINMFKVPPTMGLLMADLRGSGRRSEAGS